MTYVDYFRPIKIIKMHKDEPCLICQKNLKGIYQTEITFPVIIQICTDCSYERKASIHYLVDSNATGIPFDKLGHFLADMKLLGINQSSVIEIAKDWTDFAKD